MDTDASSSSTPRCHGSSAVRLAMISMCPKQHWLDAITPWLFHHQQVTYLNVGANKGFNVWSMMQRMHLAENYTNRDWRAEMDVYMRAQGIRTCRSKGETECGKSGEGLCGVCGACKELPPTLVRPVDATFRRLDVHAVELIRENTDWLRWAFARFGVRGSILHAGASNVSGSTMVRAAKFGDEGVFVGTASKVTTDSDADDPLAATVPAQTFSPVRILTIDQYAREEGIRHIHLASIDAEGQDALIIEGMQNLLDAARVDVLEFEYHHIGYWKKTDRSLEATLKWLQRRREPFRCYWQAANGCLAPASPPCWVAAFEIRKMSNLVCVREGAGAPHQELVRLANACA